MKTLGIDPGYGRVGVAILSGEVGSEKLLYSSCIETDKETPHNERLRHVTDEIKRVIGAWEPSELAIEKLFFTTNQKTAMQVSEARGAIISVAQDLGLKIFEYTPLQIKAGITSNGRASKKELAYMVTRILSLKTKLKRDDEYDAIATGLTHIACRRGYPQA